MSRLCVGVLLLVLASPAAAQSDTPASWTFTSGEFTIFGHTDYQPSVTLVPRIIYDTARGLDSARVIDSVRAAAPPTPAGPVGLAAGLSNWPVDQYCDGVTSATAQPLDPSALLPRIQLAARCGVRLVLIIPRRLLTTNHQTVGCSRWTARGALPTATPPCSGPTRSPSTAATLLGLNLADDYGCPACWGGKVITQAQIAEWAGYARAKLPGLAARRAQDGRLGSGLSRARPAPRLHLGAVPHPARRRRALLRRRGGDRGASRPPRRDGSQRARLRRPRARALRPRPRSRATARSR